MISRKIPYYPLSIADILNFNSKQTSKKNLGVFITSSNNQQFLCYKNKDRKLLMVCQERSEDIEMSQVGTI